MTQSDRYNAISSLTIIVLLFSLVTVHCRPVGRHLMNDDHEDFWTAPGKGSHALVSSEISPPITMDGMLSDNVNNHVRDI